jgi:hypothetical protein
MGKAGKENKDSGVMQGHAASAPKKRMRRKNKAPRLRGLVVTLSR